MAAVRPADARDVPALSAALAQAFLADALMNWLLPQRTRRIARRELMFRLELQTYVLPQDGLAFTAGDGHRSGLVGGCLVLRPQRWQMPNAVDGRSAVRWLRAFGRQLPRAIRIQKAMQEHHPSSRTTTSARSGSGPGGRAAGWAAHCCGRRSSCATASTYRRI
jgi:hypothetical protein